MSQETASHGNRPDGTTPETRAIQMALLRMLKNIDAICQRHAIRYWLDGGTLLGAVRHRGFIPWDDDLDIVMPREDYERFVGIAQAELHDDLFLQTIDTDPSYAIYQVPCKLRERAGVEIEHRRAERGLELGIYLDIIPIDKYRKSGFGFRVDYCMKYLYRRLCGINATRTKHGSGFKVFANNLLAACKGVIGPERLVKAYKQALKKKIRKNASLQSDYLVGYSFDSLWIRLFEVADIFPLKKMEFEDGLFPVPANCDSVLKTFYGNGYMQLPDPSLRVSQRSVALAPKRQGGAGGDATGDGA